MEKYRFTLESVTRDFDLVWGDQNKEPWGSDLYDKI